MTTITPTTLSNWERRRLEAIARAIAEANGITRSDATEIVAELVHKARGDLAE